MRIVFLNPIADIGGGERSLLAWIAATTRAFPDARLALIVPADGPLAAAAAQLGVDARIVPIPHTLAQMGDSAMIGNSTMPPRRSKLGLTIRTVVNLPRAARYLLRM